MSSRLKVNPAVRLLVTFFTVVALAIPARSNAAAPNLPDASAPFIPAAALPSAPDVAPRAAVSHSMSFLLSHNDFLDVYLNVSGAMDAMCSETQSFPGTACGPDTYLERYFEFVAAADAIVDFEVVLVPTAPLVFGGQWKIVGNSHLPWKPDIDGSLNAEVDMSAVKTDFYSQDVLSAYFLPYPPDYPGGFGGIVDLRITIRPESFLLFSEYLPCQLYAYSCPEWQKMNTVAVFAGQHVLSTTGAIVVPIPGMLVNLTSDIGSPEPPSGVTDERGFLPVRIQASLNEGSSQVTAAGTPAEPKAKLAANAPDKYGSVLRADDDVQIKRGVVIEYLGNCEIFRDGLWIPIERGMEVHAGDQIRCHSTPVYNASLEIEFCDNNDVTWTFHLDRSATITIGQTGVSQEQLPLFKIVDEVAQDVQNNPDAYIEWSVRKTVETVATGGYGSGVIGWLVRQGANQSIDAFWRDVNSRSDRRKPADVLFRTEPPVVQVIWRPTAQTTDSTLLIRNFGPPGNLQISGSASGTVSMPARTELTASTAGTIGAPGPLIVADSKAPSLTITKVAGGTDRQPRIAVTADDSGSLESGIDAQSLQVRVNGQLRDTYKEGDVRYISWWEPSPTTLRPGDNAIAASVRDLAGKTATATATVTATSGLAAPTGINVGAVNGRALVSWSKGFEPDLAGWNIYRGLSGGPLSKVNTSLLVSPSFRETGLTVSATYQYQVAAVDATGSEGALSYRYAVFMGLALEAAAPAAPVTATIQASDRSLRLDWATVGSAAGYRVYRSTSVAGPFTWLADATVRSFTDTGIPTGQSRWYRVSALSQTYVEGLQTAPVQGTTIDQPPSAPLGLSVAVDRLIVVLSWNPNSEADIAGYNIYRAGPTGAFTKLNASPVQGTSYSDAVTSGSSYRYQVTVIDNGGHEGAASGAILAATSIDTSGPSGSGRIFIPLAFNTGK